MYNIHLLSAYYESGTLLKPKDTAINKTDKNPCLITTYIPGDNKNILKLALQSLISWLSKRWLRIHWEGEEAANEAIFLFEDR